MDAPMRSQDDVAPFTPRRRQVSRRERLTASLPYAVLAPTLFTTFVYIFVFVGWNAYLSVSASTMLPNYRFEGFGAYIDVWSNPRWTTGVRNLVLFGILYIGLSTFFGTVLAIMMDQKVRGENLFRAVFLYPIAISFIVTGTTWQWLLNPSTGLQFFVQSLGWESFRFELLTNRDTAIYAVVLAAVWHASGFVMVMVLAGLRGVDSDLVRAGRIDGAGTVTIYRKIVLPTIWPVMISVLIVLLQFAIKTFDLVLALTHGGPGIATTFPSIFIYDRMFAGGRLAEASAAAIWLLFALLLVLAPFILIARRRARQEAR